MFKLTPVIAPIIREFISNKEIIKEVADGCGTPLNIIFPQMLSESIHGFKAILQKHHINGKIYYAHKVNKSKALVRQANYEGICLDVASENELKNALANGFRGSELEVTGPKNSSFLLLAIQHNCLIQVDNLDELTQIVFLHKKLRTTEKISILIRFSGFSSPDKKIVAKDSRFGIPIAAHGQVVQILSQYADIIAFKGFSFHLDTNTPEEKAIAVENLIQLYEIFQEAGFTPMIINIGGGFKTNYLVSEKEWNDYLAQLQQSASGKTFPMIWHTPAGVRNAFYDYFSKISGPEYLDAILSAPLDSYHNVSASQMINELMLQLLIEPGRALLNQIGITITKVNFVKESSQGEILIGLDMNRSNLASTDQEMLLDPVVIYKKHKKSSFAKASEDKKYGVYFVGNLCLESDFIYKHKTFLHKLPEPGDVVIFINTAAYNMDFTESATLQQRIAKKLAIVKLHNKFVWFEDENYNPYLLED